MKVYLGNITGGSVTTTPLSSGLLRCHVEQHFFLKREIEWGNFLYSTEYGVDNLVDTIQKPDVLGLSCYTWNINRNLKIARMVKERYPDCLIVFGGPEISERPPEFDSVDLMVMGEGELPFTQILNEYLYGGENWDSIYNVHYRDGDKFIFKDFDNSLFLKSPTRTTSPWINGYFDFIVDEMAKSGRQVVGIVETNRGCPNKCTFCVSGSDSRPIQTADLDLVLEEIDYVGRVSNEIIMTDANFGILKQDEIIAEKLAEVSQKYGILTKIFVSWVKGYNERVKRISKTLAKAGLVTAGVTVSLQTTTPDVLHTVRRKNLSMKEYAKAINDFRDMGVLTHTELIIGLPEETKESFLTSVEDVLDVGPTNLLCYMLTLNANSEIYSKETRDKYNIKTRWVNIYHGGSYEDESEYIETVSSTRDMSKDDVKWLFKWKDFFTVAYVGLRIYFISQYLKREYEIRRVDFMSNIINWGLDNPDTVIGKLLSNWYFMNYNSGSFVSYVGPKSPHNVDWGSNFFLKQTFSWLCISENKAKFYKEIEEVLTLNGMWNDQTKEALMFQCEMMIDISYDPNIGISFMYGYNWFEYFHLGHDLKKVNNRVRYRTQHAGRNKLKIKPNDPESMFTIAGGDLYKQQMQNTFIHRHTDKYTASSSNVITLRGEHNDKTD